VTQELPKPVFQDRIEDIWIGLFNLDALSNDCLMDIQLSNDEYNEVLLLKTLQLQKRFIKRKKLLKALLYDCLGIPPNAIQIKKSQYGKPFLSKPKKNMHFNTSHCAQMFLVGIGHQALGVDLEKKDNAINYTAVAKQFFTENECQELKRSQDPVHLFYTIWTQKEALLKLFGEPLKNGFIENKKVKPYHIPIPSPHIASLAL